MYLFRLYPDFTLINEISRCAVQGGIKKQELVLGFWTSKAIESEALFVQISTSPSRTHISATQIYPTKIEKKSATMMYAFIRS